MNVYDFDHTIYAGDCTIDFWRYCIRKKPGVLLAMPRAAFAAVKFGLNWCSREELKETFYRFLQRLPNVEGYIQDFWSKNLQKIRPWYLAQKRDDDLIISASPEFLISAACKSLNVHWIASKVDCRSGQLLGANCRGKEKVRRLFQYYPHPKVDKFYSDSRSDNPLAVLATHAYLVKKGKISEWNGNFGTKVIP